MTEHISSPISYIYSIVVQTSSDPQIVYNLNERLDGEVVGRLSSRKRFRIFKALEESIFVYPLDTSTYRVQSIKESQADTMYTVSVFDRPWCECKDFIYNCIGDYKSDKKQRWCKHIFRVWSEVNIGELPPIGYPPRNWLRLRLREEILRMIESEREVARNMKEAYDLLQENPEEEDYKNAINVWRKYRQKEPQSPYGATY